MVLISVCALYGSFIFRNTESKTDRKDYPGDCFYSLPSVRKSWTVWARTDYHRRWLRPAKTSSKRIKNVSSVQQLQANFCNRHRISVNLDQFFFFTGYETCKCEMGSTMHRQYHFCGIWWKKIKYTCTIYLLTGYTTNVFPRSQKIFHVKD